MGVASGRAVEPGPDGPEPVVVGTEAGGAETAGVAPSCGDGLRNGAAGKVGADVGLESKVTGLLVSFEDLPSPPLPEGVVPVLFVWAGVDDAPAPDPAGVAAGTVADGFEVPPVLGRRSGAGG